MSAPEGVMALDLNPNWGSGFEVSYEYRTDIIPVRSGDEQRRSLRSTPRRSLKFDTHLTKTAYRLFDTKIAAWQARRFAVDDPFEAIASTGPSVGVAIPVASAPRWVKAGAPVLLIAGGQREWRTVEHFTTTSLTLDASALSWPQGTIIRKGLIGRLQPSFDIRKHTDAVGGFSFVFNVDPGSEPLEDSYDLWGSPPQTFREHELFTTKPNWARDITHSLQAVVDVLDYDQGVILTNDPVEFNGRVMKATYLGRTAAQAKALIETFRRAKGRRGALYVPTWQSDIDLASAYVAGSDQIMATGSDLAAFFDIDPAYRNLALVTDQAVVPVGIKEINLQGSNSRIILDQVPNLGGRPLLMVSWLMMCRFASDSLTVAWRTNEVAEIEFAFQTLRDTFFEVTLNGERLVVGGDYVTIPNLPEPPTSPIFTIGGLAFTIGGDTIRI